MTFQMLNPSFFCHKINFIYYTEDLKEYPTRNKVLKLAIEDEKDRVRQGEYKTIKKIKYISSALCAENQKLIAEYRAREDEKI